MSAPKFTPGPWEWFGNGDHCYLSTPNRGRLYVMDFGRKGMQGATPRFSHWNRIGDGAERERSGGIMQDGHLLPDGRLHPDATLIAAAPELYAAAAHAEVWISDMPHGDNCYLSAHYDGDPSDQCNCGKESVLAALDAALAKAAP